MKALKIISSRGILPLILFFLSVFSLSAQTSEVIVTVNWPSYAEENRVQIYDATLTTLISTIDIGYVANFSNQNHNQSYNLGCVTDGNYVAVLWDASNDGWDGFGDSITITSGGTTVLNQTNNNTVNSSGTVQFAFTVSGGGGPCGSPSPEMDVFGGGLAIADGDTFPSTLDGTDFGSVTSGSPVTNTFTITNNGTATLNLTGAPVTISGGSGFTVTTQPSSNSIAAGASVTFQITYNPTVNGTVTATVSIGNDDSNENPYDFSITGFGTVVNAEIAVLGNNIEIADGDTTPEVNNHTDFGTVDVGSSQIFTYTISNTGGATLTLSGAPVVLTGNSAFAVVSQPASNTIASGASVTFQISFTPTSAIAVGGTITIANDDPDENPYNFSIRGVGATPLSEGPGGVSQDLKLWLRADRGLAYTNGQSVSTWSTQGRGTDATTPVAGLEPTYRDDAAFNLNFNPVVEFSNDPSTTVKDFGYPDLSKQVLTGTSGFYTQDIFVVTIPNTTPTTSIIMDVFTGDQNPLANEEDVTGYGYGNYSARFGSDLEIISYALGTNPTPVPAALDDRGHGVAHVNTTENYDYLSMVNARNNSTANGSSLLVNGNNVGNLETGVPQFANVFNSRYNIARSEAFNGSYNGRIVEIITYSSRKDDTSTTSDHNRIETYLALKYGITLGVNGTSQDYVSSDGNVIYDVSVGSFNYDIAGIARDDDSDLNQKQSKSSNTGSVVTMGITDISTTNNLNTNTFSSDRDYLVWGNDGAPMTTSTSTIDVNLGPMTVTTITDVLNRKWKVQETTTSDVTDVKVSVATSDFASGLPALTGNDAYVMVVSNDATFTTGIETVFMTTNGANQETTYNFDGTQYFTFGVAHETVAPRHSTFDGLDNFTRVGDVIDVSGPFSVSAWIFNNGSNTSSNNRTIVSKRGAGNDGYHFTLRNNNQLEMRFDSGSGNRLRSNTLIPTGQWRHVAFTYDGTTARMYIDGVLDNSGSIGTPSNNSHIFSIGARYVTNVDVRNFFNGNIDELRIWDRAVTVDEIRFIMNQEIFNNGGNVGGTIVPNSITRNDISSRSWGDLLAYYNMNSYLGTHLNDLSGNGHRGSLVVPDNFSIDTQTAPLPYESTANGDWDTASTWTNGSIQYTPNSQLTINGTATDITWNIVRTNHNVTLATGHTVLGLMNQSNEVTVNVDDALSVSHYLRVDGNIHLEGEAQLLQDVDSELDTASSGTLERDQQGTANAFTYNYWSSPVGNVNASINNDTYVVEDILFDGTSGTPQNINFVAGYDGADGTATSPITISGYWFYVFRNGDDDDFADWAFVGQDNDIDVGEGFTMKGNNGVSAINANQNYTFVGKPNNGDISLPITGGNNYLVGNPYPSAIDSHEFINDNSSSITGTLYYWEHWGGGTHNLGDYQGGYAMYNLSGVVGTPTLGTSDPDVNSGGTPTKLPGRYIPVSQGFFVIGQSTGTIQFNNSQRIFVTEASGNSIFVRNADYASTQSSPDASPDGIEEDTRMKIRLGFNSPNIIHRQLLLTVDNNTTLGVDWAYEGKRNDDQIDDFYWMINNEDYIIQAIPEVIPAETELPLGIKLDATGMITITIDALENVPDDTDVYIKDNLTGNFHNLRAQDFVANLDGGNTHDRYSLVFRNQEVLSVGDVDLDNSIVNYISTSHEIFVKNTNQQNKFLSGTLYSILGQEIKSWDINSNEERLQVPNISAGNYVFKLITEKGTISKKFVID